MKNLIGLFLVIGLSADAFAQCVCVVPATRTCREMYGEYPSGTPDAQNNLWWGDAIDCSNFECTWTHPTIPPSNSVIVNYWQCPANWGGLRVKVVQLPNYLPRVRNKWEWDNMPLEQTWLLPAPGQVPSNMRPNTVNPLASECFDWVACDKEVGKCTQVLVGYDPVTLDATFRWFCQTKVGPYFIPNMTTAGCQQTACVSE